MIASSYPARAARGSGLPLPAIAAALAMLASACPLFLSPDPVSDGDVGYYSKTLTYSRYVDPAESFYEPVEVRIHDKEGKLSGIYRHRYEAVPSTDYWVLARTDLYMVDANGVERLAEYYLFEYEADAYTDAELGPVTDYVIKRGESYAPNHTRYSYYDVTYLKPGDQPCVYLTNRDYELGSDEAFHEVAYDESKYRLIGGRYYFVTEKNFVAGKPGDPLELSKEFATWYKVEADGTVRWSHDLYHTKRGDGGSVEHAWLYTKYDWNKAGQVYSQQDFVYAESAVAKLANGTIDPWIGVPKVTVANIGEYNAMVAEYVTKQGYPAIAAPGGYPAANYPSAPTPTYDLTLANVSDLKETLSKSYDDLGNVVLKVRSTQGQEFERVVYRYDGDSVVSMVRYMNGASYAYDRTETRYYQATRDGIDYDVAEELVYRSYDSDVSRGSGGPSVRLVTAGGRRRALSRGDDPKDYYHLVRSNHDR